MFKTDGLKSYRCRSETTITATNNHTEVSAKLKDVFISNYFHLTPEDAKINGEVICPNDDMSDIIPIAVGAALFALVAIVLIAYCVGRRRSRRLAYQSV